jgi:hypothetical protein
VSDLAAFLGRVAADPVLWPEFDALCGFGGRLAGTPGEQNARDWAAAKLGAIAGGVLRREPVAYDGWTCREARLTDAASGRDLACTPLLGAGAAGGLLLEVADCGRGAPEQIAAKDVRGRAVLVRHEYPFASWTVHRRVKLAAAQAAGAAAFLIAQPAPGVGPVSGSAGTGALPALGISAEAASCLAAAGSRVRMAIEAAAHPAATETIVLDLPGGSEERVVLSAHIDGHPHGESALDNATGVAAVLALARAAAPFVARARRGLTVCLFSAEEWALAGSRAWLAAMTQQERARFVLNVNLDSIAGAASLTALTSGFRALPRFVQAAGAACGLPVGIHETPMQNSDHANFAAHGIPALRLLAGFDEPESHLRYLLTAADTRLLTDARALKIGALTAAAILWHALHADSAAMAGLRGAPGVTL